MNIDFDQLRLSRRQLLGSALTLSAASLLPFGKTLNAMMPMLSMDSELEQFVTLSEVLTGHTPLDKPIAQRIFNALQYDDTNFAARSTALAVQIQTSGVKFTELAQYFPTLEASLSETALKIIRAWYLGFTGTPIGSTSVDDTQFITFTQALMYRPTIDATVIPTYARGRTNYWFYPPKTVAHD